MAKYTHEALKIAAKKSDGIYGIIRILGGNPGSGGTHQHVRRKLNEYGIDTSHFVGMAANKGKAPVNKKNVLVLEPQLKTRRRASQLRRALLERGREDKCAMCGLTEWRSKPITIEIDHKNGNWRDNRMRNLRFVCPNCHSQL